MSEHTPGPWEIRRGRFAIEIRDARQHGLIAEVHPNTANARLLAAAPELLEALEGLVPMQYCDECQNNILYSCSRHGSLSRILDKAYAAIAKAKGEQA